MAFRSYWALYRMSQLLLTHCAHAHCLQFEHSGNGLMSHIRETSKVTINTSYFHPAHQHYTDEAQKAETVPSVVIYIYIYIVFRFTSKNHYSLFHPYRNHQVVSNFQNVGCFYAIERMRGMCVGETMLRRNNWCLGETVLRRNNGWVTKFYDPSIVSPKHCFTWESLELELYSVVFPNQWYNNNSF
jgi:hypothetical protein